MPIRKANDLPAIHRYITTHSTEGEAVFISRSQLPDLIPSHKAGEDGEISLLYATVNNPVSVDDELDIVAYDDYLHLSPGLTTQQGTVLRMIDLKPSKITPMHRTISFDYGVVLEGEVDLILDSGQTRVLRRGDVSVQRGTAHSFRNRSKTQWCRLMLLFMPLQKITIQGKVLESEEYDDTYDPENEEAQKEGESRGRSQGE